MLKKLMVIDNI